MESRRSQRKRSRKNRKEAAKRLLKDLKPTTKRTLAVGLALLIGATSAVTAAPADAGAHTVYAKQYAPTRGEAIVKTARMYTGLPYVYNGYWWHHNGIDCSELTMMTFAPFGKNLPDDPYALMQHGYWVSTPRAGDVVFFSEDYSGYPTHVGIATGYGTIIHASSYAGYVTETNMYYLDGYMGAKRI